MVGKEGGNDVTIDWLHRLFLGAVTPAFACWLFGVVPFFVNRAQFGLLCFELNFLTNV